METDQKAKTNRRYAIAIGVGITLFPIHNKWLLDATLINGEATLFLPVFGTIIWVLATLFFVRDNWKELNWGDKKLFIPLLIIVGSIGLSGIRADTLGGKFAPLFMGLSLLSIYLVSRKLGKDIFLPLAIGALIASLGLVIAGLINPGVSTGGLLFDRNYDIVVGFVVIGLLCSPVKKQWWLSAIVLFCLYFAGSAEAVWTIGILCVAVLCRRDWSRKIILPLSATIIVVAIFTPLGYSAKLYDDTMFRLSGAKDAAVTAIVKPFEDKSEEVIVETPEMPAEAPETPAEASVEVVSPIPPTTYTEEVYSEIDYKTSGKIEYMVKAAKDFDIIGHGYNITIFYSGIPHNVPVIITYQVGIIAALAWMFVTMFCLIKTRWKYAWISIIALSVWDHYIWTQMAPVWWILIGVSTASELKSDLVFKEVQPKVRYGYY